MNNQTLIDIIMDYLHKSYLTEPSDRYDVLIQIKYSDLNFDEYPMYFVWDTFTIYPFDSQCNEFFKFILENNINFTNNIEKSIIDIKFKDFLKIYTDEELQKFILEYCI